MNIVFFCVNRAGDFDAVTEMMRTYTMHQKPQRGRQKRKQWAIIKGANYVLIIDVVRNQTKFISQNQHES